MPRRTELEVRALSTTPRGFRVGDRVRRVDSPPGELQNLEIVNDPYRAFDLMYCVRVRNHDNNRLYGYYVGRLELAGPREERPVKSPKDTVHKIGVPKKPLP